VLDGSLEHRDSMGNGSVIRPGQIQHMRAGTGVVHSEYNPSSTEATRFLQIWIMPGERGLSPTYGERTFDRDEAAHGYVLLASRDGRNDSIALQQDVNVWVTQLDGPAARTFTMKSGRSAWVHVARGSVTVNGKVLNDGDGAAISGEAITLTHGERAEVLVFDLA
jgi:redox-sensitive bicupin YhaK (pirin superfamily)